MKKRITILYDGTVIYKHVADMFTKFVAVPLTPMIVVSQDKGINREVVYFCGGVVIKDFNKLEQKWETINEQKN